MEASDIYQNYFRTLIQTVQLWQGGGVSPRNRGSHRENVLALDVVTPPPENDGKVKPV